MADSTVTGSEEMLVVGNANVGFWLFNPLTGYDLTHPARPDGPVVSPRLKMATVTMPITIAPAKTAFIVIDMQNLFLSPHSGRPAVRGPGHDAEDMLLSTGFPAARQAGIQIIHVTWGISDEELSVLPPTIWRAFGYIVTDDAAKRTEVSGVELGQTGEKKSPRSVGEEMGPVTLPDGSTVPAGRLLMRDQWNTALTDRLQKSYEESQSSPLPDLRFHKQRLSGFPGGTKPVIEFLRQRGITTLLFTGVNTDQCVFGSLQDAANLGFDTILLKDGCGTASPDYARQMVEYNCRKGGGFLSSCKALADGVKSMQS